LASWWDEDERELWMAEYNRYRTENNSAKVSVQAANTALAEVRSMGVFDEPDDAPELELEEARGTFDHLDDRVASALLAEIKELAFGYLTRERCSPQKQLNQIETLLAEALEEEEEEAEGEA
jgi:hypothetical protein